MRREFRCRKENVSRGQIEAPGGRAGYQERIRILQPDHHCSGQISRASEVAGLADDMRNLVLQEPAAVPTAEGGRIARDRGEEREGRHKTAAGMERGMLDGAGAL